MKLSALADRQRRAEEAQRRALEAEPAYRVQFKYYERKSLAYESHEWIIETDYCPDRGEPAVSKQRAEEIMAQLLTYPERREHNHTVVRDA